MCVCVHDATTTTKKRTKERREEYWFVNNEFKLNQSIVVVEELGCVNRSCSHGLAVFREHTCVDHDGGITVIFCK